MKAATLGECRELWRLKLSMALVGPLSTQEISPQGPWWEAQGPSEMLVTIFLKSLGCMPVVAPKSSMGK